MNKVQIILSLCRAYWMSEYLNRLSMSNYTLQGQIIAQRIDVENDESIIIEIKQVSPTMLLVTEKQGEKTDTHHFSLEDAFDPSLINLSEYPNPGETPEHIPSSLNINLEEHIAAIRRIFTNQDEPDNTPDSHTEPEVPGTIREITGEWGPRHITVTDRSGHTTISGVPNLQRTEHSITNWEQLRFRNTQKRVQAKIKEYEAWIYQRALDENGTIDLSHPISSKLDKVTIKMPDIREAFNYMKDYIYNPPETLQKVFENNLIPFRGLKWESLKLHEDKDLGTWYSCNSKPMTLGSGVQHIIRIHIKSEEPEQQENMY